MALISAERADAVLAAYERALADSSLAGGSQRAYWSRVRGFLRWLASGEVGGSDLGGDPLAVPAARDRAIEEYRSWIRTERDARPSTINATLTALDHFYDHLRLGSAVVPRDEPTERPPRVLDRNERRRFLHALEARDSARDRAIGHALLHTGIRPAELVALDLTDLHATGKRARIVVPASRRSRARELTLPTESRGVLRRWMRERAEWPGADANPACFLNRRGGRLTTRWITDLVVRLGDDAGIAVDNGRLTPNVLRHTFAAQLLADGTHVVAVAELMGYKRLDTARSLALAGDN